MMASLPVKAAQIGDLPGEEVSGTPEINLSSSQPLKTKTPSIRPNTWLAPAVEEQLSRDRILIPMGKGAVFIPSFTEPRREPEVTLFNARGRQVQNGQTGERIVLDSGTYTLRFGSGTSGQQFSSTVDISEGHTIIKDPDWSGLIVETLLPNGIFIEGQYEVIRMSNWVNFGKGRGLKEERLQDLKTWIVPAGIYRISKPGEGFNSLRNYITVQLNPGELHKLELIFDKDGGDIISGGTKTLTPRAKIGSNWTYGVRAGGNVNLSRLNEESGSRKEATQVTSDIRLQLLFDNVRYLGSSELLLQDNFNKMKGQPFSAPSDIANFRTNWVRRMNSWLGAYVRGSIESHVFPRSAGHDTVYIIQSHTAPGNPDSTYLDTTLTPGSIDLDVNPFLDPMNFGEGFGLNIEFLSRYYLEASTQIGLAGRQYLAFDSYVANNDSSYTRARSKYEIGIENTLNATLRLGSQATLDFRTIIFAPNANLNNLRLDDLSADFRFFVSRNIEVGYIFLIKASQAKAKNHYPSTHNLSLRLSFNF
jgi:hypothetical protein